MAARYATADNRLGLVGRNAERLAAVEADLRPRAGALASARLDVTDRVALCEAMAGFEASAPIDLLIVNAGILDGRKQGETAEDGETARRVITTNLDGALDTVHAVLPAMQRRGRGHIVIVSSLAAFSPLADAPAYAASKAALLSYGLAMREALEPAGIAVSVVTPGYVETGMTRGHVGAHPFKIGAEQAARRIEKGIARNEAIIGFPLPLYLASRLSLLLPEPLRRFGSRGLRFHVAASEPG